MKRKIILSFLIAVMCLMAFTGTNYAKTQTADTPYEYVTYTGSSTIINNDKEYTPEKPQSSYRDMEVLDDDVQIPEHEAEQIRAFFGNWILFKYPIHLGPSGVFVIYRKLFSRNNGKL